MREYQSGINTAEACKQGCADDADCIYAQWWGAEISCYFSSDCSLVSDSTETTYVSLCSQQEGAVGRRGARQAHPHHSLFLLISPPPSLPLFFFFFFFYIFSYFFCLLFS